MIIYIIGFICILVIVVLEKTILNTLSGIAYLFTACGRLIVKRRIEQTKIELIEETSKFAKDGTPLLETDDYYRDISYN